MRVIIPEPLWTQIPDAAALLADCAANPPALDHRTGTFERPAQMFKTDKRVKALNAIHRREADRIFAACEATRNYDPYSAHAAFGVQTAIETAIVLAQHNARIGIGIAA